MAPSCTQLAKGPPVNALSRTSARRSSESQSWLNHSPGPRNHSPGGHELRLSAAGASAGTVPRPAHALQTHTERPARARIAKFALPKRAPGSSGASRQGRRPSAGRAHRRAQRCRQDLCIDSPCRVRPRRVGAAQASRPRGWYRTCSEACLYCEKFTEPANTPREHLCFFFKPIQGLDPHFPIFVAGLFLPAFSSVQVIQVR